MRTDGCPLASAVARAIAVGSGRSVARARSRSARKRSKGDAGIGTEVFGSLSRYGTPIGPCTEQLTLPPPPRHAGRGRLEVALELSVLSFQARQALAEGVHHRGVELLTATGEDLAHHGGP